MTPRRFAVLGDPVAHSKSPAMQAAALRALGLPHTYEAIRATPDELPRRSSRRCATGAFDGLNVTVPHKRRVLALADEWTPAPRAWARRTRSSASRTAASSRTTPTPRPALASCPRCAGDDDVGDGRGPRARLGGAARAAIAALDAHLGVREVVVRARAAARPREPVRSSRAGPDAASEASTLAIVQATSAGMHGADPGEAVAARRRLGRAAPRAPWRSTSSTRRRDTPFLRAARAPRVCAATDGLGMLARQGALALELWLRQGAAEGASRLGGDARGSRALGAGRSTIRARSVPKNRQRLGYRRIVQLLVFLVVIPTVLLLLVGIVAMFVGRGSVFNLLFGVLTVSFVLVAVTGVVLVLVFLRREANLSDPPGRLRLQGQPRASHAADEHPPLRRDDGARARRRGDAATSASTALGRETERLTLASSSACSTGGAWRPGASSSSSAKRRVAAWSTTPCRPSSRCEPVKAA